MKIILSITCALFLLGCNNSTPTEASAPAVVEENNSATTAPENASTEQTTAVAPTTEMAAPKAPVAASVDGGALFTQKCVSCHGAKAEKAALGKSQIIATFSEAQIKDALKGYQAGTYGKEMKAVMQGQAKALDDAQIDALAKHISSL
jgi:cytochrome c